MVIQQATFAILTWGIQKAHFFAGQFTAIFTLAVQHRNVMFRVCEQKHNRKKYRSLLKHRPPITTQLRTRSGTKRLVASHGIGQPYTTTWVARNLKFYVIPACPISVVNWKTSLLISFRSICLWRRDHHLLWIENRDIWARSYSLTMAYGVLLIAFQLQEIFHRGQVERRTITFANNRWKRGLLRGKHCSNGFHIGQKLPGQWVEHPE